MPKRLGTSLDNKVSLRSLNYIDYRINYNLMIAKFFSMMVMQAHGFFNSIPYCKLFSTLKIGLYVSINSSNATEKS